jgi:hypothetical protein
MTTDQTTQTLYKFSSAATLIWETDETGKVLGVTVLPHYDTHEVYEVPEDATVDGTEVLVLADDQGWAFPDEMFVDDEKVALEWAC